MDEKMARFVSAGKLFQKSAVAVVAAAIGTVFALGGAPMSEPEVQMTAQYAGKEQHGEAERDAPAIVIAKGFEKLSDVTLAGSTGKLRICLNASIQA